MCTHVNLDKYMIWTFYIFYIMNVILIERIKLLKKMIKKINQTQVYISQKNTHIL